MAISSLPIRLILAIAIFAVLVPPATADRIDDAVRETQAAHDLQSSLPGIEAAPEGDAAKHLEQLKQPKVEGLGWLARLLGSVGVLVFWGVVIAIVILLLVAVAREVPYLSDYLKRRKPPKTDADDAHEAIVSAIAEKSGSLLAEADRLAAEGRYGEALRYLLYQTIEEIGRIVGAHAPRAFTSREILRKASLPSDAHDAFDDMVAAVEISHFGGRSVSADAYATCRQSYKRFADLGTTA